MLNATPDVTAQMLRSPQLHPRNGTRHTPVRGVLLTDAELDHTLGLLHLREGDRLAIHATSVVAEALEQDLRVLGTLRCYTDVEIVIAKGGEPVLLGDGPDAISVEWLTTGNELPRYAGERHAPGAVSALELVDQRSGRRALYAPGAGQVDQFLLDRLRGADAIFFDGTFWSEDEFPKVSGRKRSAKDMGHLPVSGREGSAQLLADMPAKVKRYIHINNTNPVLDPDSRERRSIREMGLELAEDGEEVEI